MWAQILNTLLGIWLMAAPAVLRYNGVAADNDNIIGPVVATFAIVALSGCTRAVALYNIPLGIWLLLSPWVLGYDHDTAVYNSTMTGIFITLFSFFRRKTANRYGGGWKAIWRSGMPHEEEARRLG